MDRKLKTLLYRTNKAYERYKLNPVFHNALHIYYANQEIYEILNSSLGSCDIGVSNEDIINYLFHLEDWFALFEKNKEQIESLEEQFIFNSFKDHIPFPKIFKINDL